MPMQSGSYIFGSDKYPELVANRPPRTRPVQDLITFATPFATVPTVIVSLNLVDSENTTNLRIAVGTDTINTQSFELVVTTWWDTAIFSVGISWIAYTD